MLRTAFDIIAMSVSILIVISAIDRIIRGRFDGPIDKMVNVFILIGSAWSAIATIAHHL